MADKLQPRAYRLLASALSLLDEYVATDATGLRVLASMADLSARRRLAAGATSDASADARQSLLGPLACFTAIGERLVAAHSDLLAAAGKNLVTVVAALQQMVEGLAAIEAELQDAVERVPSLQRSLLATCTAELPWSVRACAGALGDARRCVTYDLLLKLDVAAAVFAALGATGVESGGRADSLGRCVVAAGRRWPSPIVGGEVSNDEDSSDDGDSGSGGDTAAEARTRANFWSAVNDCSERVRGRGFWDGGDG